MPDELTIALPAPALSDESTLPLPMVGGIRRRPHGSRSVRVVGYQVPADEALTVGRPATRSRIPASFGLTPAPQPKAARLAIVPADPADKPAPVSRPAIRVAARAPARALPETRRPAVRMVQPVRVRPAERARTQIVDVARPFSPMTMFLVAMAAVLAGTASAVLTFRAFVV